MKKQKLYRYLGRNGILTTYIFLDGIQHIPMYRLSADENNSLTDGEKIVKEIEIFAEDLDKWQEIPSKDQKI